tara:strand:- start:549 stop:797 length:249 start_codon:yes stop_codon:yes gene_type:complete
MLFTNSLTSAGTSSGQIFIDAAAICILNMRLSFGMLPGATELKPLAVESLSSSKAASQAQECRCFTTSLQTVRLLLDIQLFQ